MLVSEVLEIAQLAGRALSYAHELAITLSNENRNATAEETKKLHELKVGLAASAEDRWKRAIASERPRPVRPVDVQPKSEAYSGADVNGDTEAAPQPISNDPLDFADADAAAK